ncbi:MAG: hypothetical protein DBY32_01100 [Phascolarctobacterium sp.]|nr:MAG: hypothetical protein DBY32_01100 [Phascolarctobacterium sp.]
MRPHDIRAYCNINPQAIREGMKAGKLDIGFAVQQKGGRRWTYVIIPEKFFKYIGQPVPPEWEKVL